MQLTQSVTFHSFSSAWDPVSSADLEIDMSGATFVQPVGLVGLIALVEHAVRDGRNVRFIKPTNHNVANYLSRMGVGAELERFGVAHDLPVVRNNPAAAELLEVQKVSGEYAGERVAEIVANKLRGADADPQIVEALHSAICEVVGNIEFHADVDGGFVAAQTTHSGQRVVFAVADSGIGLRKSLEEKMPVNDDANAIELAVVANISGTGETGRGQGLPDVVSTSTALNGTVNIASGKATSKHVGDTITKRTVINPFPGTLIQVELDCRPGAS